MNIDMSLDDMMKARKNGDADGATDEQAAFQDGGKGKQGGAYFHDDGSAKSKRVFVGNLAWTVTWRELKDHMRVAGLEVVHADVLMGGDGRSKGCGIVEFQDVESASRACAMLNDSELMGRQIFVREDREEARPQQVQQMSTYNTGRGAFNPPQQQGGYNTGRGAAPAGPFTQQRPDKQGCRVYVGNLAWDVAWQDLKDHMRQAGDVTFAEVMQEADGRSKGCGIVEFANAQAAQQAIATLNDSDLKGRMIFVREDRENRQGMGGGGNSCSVYVGNLHFDVSWQDLKDHMRATGNVDQADILTGEDGRSKGCGIVTYQNPQGANRAIRELQNSTIHGRPIFVREDREAGKGAQNTQLFVGNLSYETTWKELKDHFRSCGEVERADVQYQAEDPTRSKGWGTIKFARARDAANAINQLNGSDLQGRQIQVRIDKQGS